MVDKNKFSEQEGLEHNTYIIGKNFPLTEPMRQHVLAKLSKIERFHNHIMNVHVVLEIQRTEHHCSIVCHFNHFQAKVEASSSDMYASIDRAIQKLQLLFRKWKGKIQDYHKKPMHMSETRVDIYNRPHVEAIDETEAVNEEIEAENLKDWVPKKVSSTETHAIKTLTTDEAIMKMELSADQFLLYRDAGDTKLRLMYRRKDQNYGVIQAEG